MIKPLRRTFHTANGPAVLAGHKLCDDGELKTIRGIAASVAAIRRQLESVGHDVPRKALQAARNAYQADPSAANFAKLRATDNLQEAREKCSTARSQIKMAMRTEADKVIPILDEMNARAAKIVRARIAAVTKSEQAVAREIGIEFVPSESIGALENLLARYETPVASGLNNNVLSHFPANFGITF